VGGFVLVSSISALPEVCNVIRITQWEVCDVRCDKRKAPEEKGERREQRGKTTTEIFIWKKRSRSGEQTRVVQYVGERHTRRSGREAKRLRQKRCSKGARGVQEERGVYKRDRERQRETERGRSREGQRRADRRVGDIQEGIGGEGQRGAERGRERQREAKRGRQGQREAQRSKERQRRAERGRQG
jgi:hypothetical protein